MHMDARLQGLAKDLLAKPDTFMLSFDLIDETTENPAALCEGINAILASTESSIRATLVEDNDNGAVHMVSNQHTLPLFPPASERPKRTSVRVTRVLPRRYKQCSSEYPLPHGADHSPPKGTR
jgi:hypothetical protein